MAEVRRYEFTERKPVADPHRPKADCPNCDGRGCMGCVLREYEHDCADDCPICCEDNFTAETVTAYDARDVEPLVHALELTAALNPAAVGDNDLAHVAIDKARAALPPFTLDRSNRNASESHDEASNSQGEQSELTSPKSDHRGDG